MINVITMDRPKAPSRNRRVFIAAIFIALGLAALVPAIVAALRSEAVVGSSASRLIVWVTPS